MTRLQTDPAFLEADTGPFTLAFEDWEEDLVTDPYELPLRPLASGTRPPPIPVVHIVGSHLPDTRLMQTEEHPMGVRWLTAARCEQLGENLRAVAEVIMDGRSPTRTRTEER